MSAAFESLSRITETLYQADLARLAAIAAEEAAVQAELDDLALELRRYERAAAQDQFAQGRYGGDLLWQAWVGRKRRMLNLKLANIRARKLGAAEMLRRSFGKNSVARALSDQARASKAGRATLQELSAQQAQMVLRAGTQNTTRRR